MKDVLETLERWTGEGLRVATATVVSTERSAPRDPGAALAVSERGEVAGSVTGGCVEPAVYDEAQAVLAGGPPRLLRYGIADDDAFEVGLPCGGTVHIFVDLLDPALVAPIADAIRAERPVALAVKVTGPAIGEKQLVHGGGDTDGGAGQADAARPRRDRDRRQSTRDEVFVSSFAPRPHMYVFGAIDHASSVASIGRFLGYRVTVCDARAKFVTRERFPDVDELVVEWPDRFLEQAPIDERTAICCPHARQQVRRADAEDRGAQPAGYIGAMGARRTPSAGPSSCARGRHRGRARPHPRADRADDRLPQPRGGRRRGRRGDHVGLQLEDPTPVRRRRSLEARELIPGRGPPQSGVGALLMDVPRIIPCMPGAKLDETVSDSELEGDDAGEARPDRADVRDRLQAEEADEGPARSRSGRTRGSTEEPRPRERADRLDAHEAGGGTRVDIVTDVTLPGAVAQYGRGMIEDISSQMVTSFADCLQAQLGDSTRRRPRPPSPRRRSRSGPLALLRQHRPQDRGPLRTAPAAARS